MEAYPLRQVNALAIHAQDQVLDLLMRAPIVDMGVYFYNLAIRGDPMTIPEFATACGCQPVDIEFLIRTKRLIVSGDDIDPELCWLARLKLQGCGRMTAAGEYVPPDRRPRKRAKPVNQRKRRIAV